MKRQSLLTTFLGAALAMPALAEKHAATGEELAANQAYNYWMLDSVKSLDPQLASSVEDSDVIRSLVEGPYNETSDG